MKKIINIISFISCVLFIISIIFSIVIIIKYNDYPYLQVTTLEQRYMWEHYDMKTYELWKAYWSEYNMVSMIFWISGALFVLSGIPIWKRNIENPGRLMNERDKKLIKHILKFFIKNKKN